MIQKKKKNILLTNNNINDFWNRYNFPIIHYIAVVFVYLYFGRKSKEQYKIVHNIFLFLTGFFFFFFHNKVISERNINFISSSRFTNKQNVTLPTIFFTQFLNYYQLARPVLYGSPGLLVMGRIKINFGVEVTEFVVLPVRGDSGGTRRAVTQITIYYPHAPLVPYPRNDKRADENDKIPTPEFISTENAYIFVMFSILVAV